MAKVIPNSFTSYEFTDKEALQGSIFTTLQLQVLQNTLSDIAETKLNLEIDSDKPDSFIQQDAYQKGQLDIISHLITRSAASKEELQPSIEDD